MSDYLAARIDYKTEQTTRLLRRAATMLEAAPLSTTLGNRIPYVGPLLSVIANHIEQGWTPVQGGIALYATRTAQKIIDSQRVEGHGMTWDSHAATVVCGCGWVDAAPSRDAAMVAWTEHVFDENRT